ncbi:MAG: saccharopine dehydrogenase NADP-binding domain-containing protein [Polyangiaceae bacterium]|nr:saccharopine dehydrogenase NADP-binding domain-containing protein [Polyangiaceae bacterium]
MTTSRPWMIYGASGYTGKIVIEEALARGHRPVVAGRSPDKVRPIAESFGLPWAAFDLTEVSRIIPALADVHLVLHCAGPFIHTSANMVTACLARGVHYLDVTGEIPVFAAIFDRDEEARRAKVTLLPGVGFDVVPTDCLAKYVSEKIPNARFLEIAFASLGQSSAGTAKSAIEMSQRGNFVRREGALVPAPLGDNLHRVRFSDRERDVVSIPWGDLETAYKSTGIANIATYWAMPPTLARGLKVFGSGIVSAMQNDRLRETLKRFVDRHVDGPNAEERERGRSFVYAMARDAAGKTAEAWLETLEGYAFTTKAAVYSVERVLQENPIGALTPSLAFGSDFVLSIPTTKRFDSLPSMP